MVKGIESKKTATPHKRALKLAACRPPFRVRTQHNSQAILFLRNPEVEHWDGATLAALTGNTNELRIY